MAYKFNPFTGTLDEVEAGGGGTTPPAGSDTQVQFNDGGAFGGDAGLVYDKTTDKLTVGGDINLDSGGTYSTTIQSVTPTANRTISFPDQTGTVGLVSGATGNIQYNNAGQLAGTGDLNTELDWVSPTGTYTALKVNADSNGGNTGTLLDLQVDGTSKLSVSNLGRLVAGAPGASAGGDHTFYFTSGAGQGITFTDVNNSIHFKFSVYGAFVWGNLSGYGFGATNTIDVKLQRDSAGVVAITDGSTGTGYLKQTPVLTSALPAAATVGAGTRGFVSDATATTFASVVTGSGTASTAGTVPVYSDGTDWRIG